MKKLTFIFLFAITALLFNGCETPWQTLFNGENLDNWDTHIGTSIKGFEDLHRKASVEKVFQVVEENGEKLIHISGEVNGSLATQESFSNYHLELVFKWGETVYSRRNSGLLYHSFGKFGEAIGTWMPNIECQLMHDKLGDTYLMNNTYCETAVKKADKAFVYAKDGEVTKFSGEHNGRGIKKAVDAEKALGEWNTVELYSVGQTTVHVVNGKVTMVNANTSKLEDGKLVALTGGKIQLQSEGGDLYIKSIMVRPIKKIPEELLK